ncbi:MAG: Smr/MutS family protein, partial [FCB group bacterium]
EILSNSDPDSLVLIDEIGSGTDPQEGSALAAGILDTLIELKSFFVATTHQSSLKTYALNKTEIENDSLEFDTKALKPTYKFLQGIPGNSYAFVLAKNFGITELVLNRAKKYLGTNQSQLEDSISQLQKYKSEAEESAMIAEQEKVKSEKIRKDYEQRLSEIKQKKQTIIADARQEAHDIVLKANSLVEATIKEIREDKRSIANIKKDYVDAKKVLEKDIRESSKVKNLQGQEKAEKVMQDFKVGDDVFSDDSTVIGTIQEIDKAGKTAMVNFRGLKFKLPLSKLNKSGKVPVVQSSHGDYFKFDGKTTLDIHGKRAAEALREVDTFVSNALLGNLPYVTIVHGRGTGSLRQAVNEFLEKYPSKLKWRKGNHLEGGDGVTIIEF